jgi:hypothetical protein
MRKKSKLTLETDDDGNPVLPNPDKGGGMKAAQMEQAMRTFLTAKYRMFKMLS